MDAICSSFTPQVTIKKLGGLICPGTLTGPQAQEREREQASKQAGRQAGKQASKQARVRKRHPLCKPYIA